MKKIKMMFSCVLLGSLIATVSLAAGPNKITKCKTITKPGSYQVVKNLKATKKRDGHCIIIEADNVTLDLNGFTITGLLSSGVIGCNGVWDNDVERHGVVVRNGIITDFATGIDLNKSVGGTVENIVAHDNAFGIYVGYGFDVRENNAFNNSDTGFFIREHSLVTRNIAKNNDYQGMYVRCRSILTGNISMGNGAVDSRIDIDGACQYSNNIP